MDELKLTGNCLKGTRPLLSFDKVRPGNPVCCYSTIILINME